MRERANVSKRVRFEVFKRDAFKCQYCGAEAPSVVLHVDHIKPASDGGSDDMLNLVTSCAGCNLGKSDVPLDDASAVAKSRAQMEELQERREQLEMMLEWRSGLASIAEQEVDVAVQEWDRLAPGFVPNDVGRRNLAKAIRKYGLRSVLDAMTKASDDYLRWDGATVTADSWEEAFKKVPGIAKYEEIRRKDPEGAKWLHVRNAACKRFGVYPNKAGQWLDAVRSWGGTIDEAWATVRNAHSYSTWSDEVDALLTSLRSENRE
jgi:hypothetical protein